ncbi:MAG: hypothetical protein DRI75_11565 [Bacteroidetes bacterium]|nr:MAG: hypothetical protein DRI75_11565 [Bacteroidota bacterium]
MKTKLLSLLLVLISYLALSQTTAIPDAIFEQELVNQGKDTNGMTGDILNTDAQAVTSLNVEGLGITDLTGIEAFTSLTYLVCSDNSLTTLNVSSNTALQILLCSYNSLSSLDVTLNTNLLSLSCDNNQISSLNLNQNLLLGSLGCSNNPLTGLDVTMNTELLTLACSSTGLNSLNLNQNILLQDLTCVGNNLTSLDLSNNTALQLLTCSFNNLISLNLGSNSILWNLDCSNNQITTLDLSLNPALFIFKCSSNQLTSLDLRNGTNSSVPVNNFIFAGNPNLTCINVDNATYSTNTWTSFLDPQMFFSEDCSLGFDEFESSNFKIYPIPARDYISIDSNLTKLENIKLYNLNGELISSNNYPNTNKSHKIDVSSFAKGMYILQVQTDKGILYKKIIIQ